MNTISEKDVLKKRALGLSFELDSLNSSIGHYLSEDDFFTLNKAMEILGEFAHRQKVVLDSNAANQLIEDGELVIFEGKDAL